MQSNIVNRKSDILYQNFGLEKMYFKEYQQKKQNLITVTAVSTSKISGTGIH